MITVQTDLYPGAYKTFCNGVQLLFHLSISPDTERRHSSQASFDFTTPYVPPPLNSSCFPLTGDFSLFGTQGGFARETEVHLKFDLELVGRARSISGTFFSFLNSLFLNAPQMACTHASARRDGAQTTHTCDRYG